MQTDDGTGPARSSRAMRSRGSNGRRPHHRLEEPDVRPTSPVLREGPLGNWGSLLGATAERSEASGGMRRERPAEGSR